jgi:hypothetical protein
MLTVALGTTALLHIFAKRYVCNIYEKGNEVGPQRTIKMETVNFWGNIKTTELLVGDAEHIGKDRVSAYASFEYNSNPFVISRALFEDPSLYRELTGHADLIVQNPEPDTEDAEHKAKN